MYVCSYARMYVYILDLHNVYKMLALHIYSINEESDISGDGNINTIAGVRMLKLHVL